MNMKLKHLMFLGFSIVFVMLYDNVEYLGVFVAITFGCFTLFDFLKGKEFKYIHLWNTAFIYIVCSEIILRSEELQNISEFGLEAVKLSLYANYFVNLGHAVSAYTKENRGRMAIVVPSRNNKERVFYLLISLALLYFVVSFPAALQAFRVGRLTLQEEQTTSFVNIVVGGLGLALPSILTYYHRFILKNRFLVLYIISLFLLIFPQFLWGTRFALLFSIVSSAIIWLYKRQLKRSVTIFIFGLGFLFLVVLNYIKLNRNAGDEKQEFSLLTNESSVSFPKQLASFGSDEGVVYGTAMMLKYIKEKDYLYGEASSFILYFWVPRDLWKDKPLQISHWLVREYSTTNYSGVHSAAYGFWGELFIDFGYFSLPIFLALGLGMKKLDVRRSYCFRHPNYQIVLYSLLFPYLFLSVRSPQTAFISGVFLYITYRAIGFVIVKYAR